MKLLTTLCLASITFVSAQDIQIENHVASVSTDIENVTTNTISNDIVLPFLYDDKSFIAKKKSYKNIIENTLTGKKHLVFKMKRSTKIC